MSDELKPYSVHSFMLPFRWDYLPKGYDINIGKEAFNFEERTKLSCFLSCLLADNSKWQRKFFKIGGKAENFNEIHYFHAYAAKTMFDLQQKSEETEADIDDNKVMVYFELPVNNREKDRYIINTVKNGTFELLLTGVSLHVYNTGIAILTINTENHNESQNSKEAILQINEYGRRIYPQFLSRDSPHTHLVKEAFLADAIQLHIDKMGTFTDDFKEYENLAEREVHHFKDKEFIRSWVVRTPKFIRDLFGAKFAFIQQEEYEYKVRLNVLTDDRMFFQCWYGNNAVSNILTPVQITDEIGYAFSGNYQSGDKEQKFTAQGFGKKDGVCYPHLTDNFWQAYMFGDRDCPSIANSKMQADLSEKHTYPRWAGYGTLYGFTKDSFVCITGSDFSEHIIDHMKTTYYQLTVLCLAQRVSVLRFSSEVSTLADLARSDEKKRLIADIKVLYKNYIEFINKVYYREITPYIQGMEMYRQFQDIMELKENVKDLDEELNELFTYIKLEEDEKQSYEAHKLNKLATWFLPAGFIVGLMSINAYESKEMFWGGRPDWPVWYWIIFAISMSIVFGGLMFFVLNFKQVVGYIKKKLKK